MTVDELFAAHWRSADPCVFCGDSVAFENYSSSPLCRARIIQTGVAHGVITQEEADVELVKFPACEPPVRENWRDAK